MTEKPKDPTKLRENLRTLRRRPIPPGLLMRINENARKDDKLEEEEQANQKNKSAKVTKRGS